MLWRRSNLRPAARAPRVSSRATGARTLTPAILNLNAGACRNGSHERLFASTTAMPINPQPRRSERLVKKTIRQAGGSVVEPTDRAACTHDDSSAAPRQRPQGSTDGDREIRDGGKFQKMAALASHELDPNRAAMAAAITPPTRADKSQESLTTTSLLSPRQRNDRGHARFCKSN